MSSQASKAELHRILSGEKDLESNNGYEEPAPRIVIDPAYFNHVGAVFGPRKDSYPDYPERVDLYDNKAAAQPGPAKPYLHYAYQLRTTPERAPPHSPPTPTLTPTQKGPFMLPTEYKLHEHRRLAQAKGKKSSKQYVPSHPAFAFYLLSSKCHHWLLGRGGSPGHFDAAHWMSWLLLLQNDGRCAISRSQDGHDIMRLKY